MTNILKENFEKYLKARYGSTIDTLSRAFSKFGIDYFLIGALSRDLWVQHIEGLPPIRMTTDIDFAVLVNDRDQYHDIMQHLIDIENFVEDPEPYRLYSPNDIIVDLIPFGKIEKNHEVRIQGKKWNKRSDGRIR
jgi:predicted nucleotidyltransferase